MEKINPGVKNQIDETTMVYYNKITAESIEELFKELEDSRVKTNLPPYGYIGGGLYHIGGGCYTSKKGFDEFEQSFHYSLQDMIKSPAKASIKAPEIGLKRMTKTDINKIKKRLYGQH